MIQQMREHIAEDKRERELKKETNQNMKKQRDEEAMADYRNAQALMKTVRLTMRNGTFAKAQRREASKQLNSSNTGSEWN